ncbi:hypothetical protein HDU91_003773 [Kappamyces sp. JEL0680]|nr:hypothetical protein HDU91_003773 [Kappamyces sp. JEL0680]
MLQLVEDQQWFDETQDRNQFYVFGRENIPPSVLSILEPIANSHLAQLFPSGLWFDQMISNFYSCGKGIAPHVDLARFDDGILICSLKGTALMHFRHLLLDRSYNVFLQPGDVVLLTGSSRYDWTHGIEDTTADEYGGRLYPRTERISITLRRLVLDSDGLLLDQRGASVN